MWKGSGGVQVVYPTTTEGIRQYGIGVYHLNRFWKQAPATTAPVVGVAITTEVPVPGSATGASHLDDVESAVRFCLEVAKAFGAGTCSLYDEQEFARLLELYGEMRHLQTPGRHRSTNRA